MASTKETILEELDFLDKIALDESPKGKSKGKKKSKTNTDRKPNPEVSGTSEESAILKFVDGMSNSAALAVINAYRQNKKAKGDFTRGLYYRGTK